MKMTHEQAAKTLGLTIEQFNAYREALDKREKHNDVACKMRDFLQEFIRQMNILDISPKGASRLSYLLKEALRIRELAREAGI